MNDTINFILNTKDIKAVKKMKIVPGVENINIFEFLIYIEVTTNNQIRRHLSNIVDLEGLDKEILNFSVKDVSTFIKELSSPSFIKIFEKYTKGEYKQNKELLDILKSYSLNKFLKVNKLMNGEAIGYHEILFPTRKKQLKKVLSSK